MSFVYSGRDWLRHNAAHDQATRIRAYWLGRGYRGIQTWVELAKTKNGEVLEGVHCVRSNIGPSGFPPKRTELGVAA